MILETKLDKGQRILYSIEKFKESIESAEKQMFLIWFVAKHDDVPAKIELIDSSFARKLSNTIEDKFIDPTNMSSSGMNSYTSEELASRTKDEHSVMLVDPGSNNMMRTYWLRTNEIEFLGTSWKPPLQLTIHETNIVNLDQSVLLLGRGGTGKTYCLCSRIHRDQVMHRAGKLRCLFVAYTDRLKDSVKYIYENMCSGSTDYEGATRTNNNNTAATAVSNFENVDNDAQYNGEAALGTGTVAIDDENIVATAGYFEWQRGQINRDSTLDYYRMKLLVRKLYDDLVLANKKKNINRLRDRNIDFPEAKYIDFKRFKEEFWNLKLDKKYHEPSAASGYKGKNKDKDKAKDKDPYVDAGTVWTQIYSYIKGSVDTYKHGEEDEYKHRALPRAYYIDFEKLSKNRCRLDKAHRETAYTIYRYYSAWLGYDKEHGAGYWDETDLVMSVLIEMDRQLKEGAQCKYDKIYIDEVQDFTQAELGILVLASGRDSKALFMAGDSAQTINTGVAFRFEDVRTCFHELKHDGSDDKIDRRETLTTNFRSHQGILLLASFVLNIVKEEYPGCLDEMKADMGLAGMCV